MVGWTPRSTHLCPLPYEHTHDPYTIRYPANSLAATSRATDACVFSSWEWTRCVCLAAVRGSNVKIIAIKRETFGRNNPFY